MRWVLGNMAKITVTLTVTVTVKKLVWQRASLPQSCAHGNRRPAIKVKVGDQDQDQEQDEWDTLPEKVTK